MQNNEDSQRPSASSLGNFSAEFELPKVRAFDELLSKPARPRNFKLFEHFGDTFLDFGAYYYAPSMLPDEPESNLKKRIPRLVTNNCLAWICDSVRMEGTDQKMTQYLKGNGILAEGMN